MVTTRLLTSYEVIDDELVTITTLLQRRAYRGLVGELRYNKHISAIWDEHMLQHHHHK